jgi:hypothetical protein
MQSLESYHLDQRSKTRRGTIKGIANCEYSLKDRDRSDERKVDLEEKRSKYHSIVMA